jgi:hypothetical protein
LDSHFRTEDGLPHHDRTDGLAQPLFERVGRVITAALARQQRLEMLLQAVFLQAWTAFIQMALQQRTPLAVALVIQE